MANSSSARKRIRQTATKTQRNKITSTRLKTARKELKSLVDGGKAKDAEKLLGELFSRTDRAAKNGVIHKNTAARIKARSAALVGAGQKS